MISTEAFSRHTVNSLYYASIEFRDAAVLYQIARNLQYTVIQHLESDHPPLQPSQLRAL